MDPSQKKQHITLSHGQHRGNGAGSSIEKIVKRHAEKAGLKRYVHPHMLRHTFAMLHMEI